MAVTITSSRLASLLDVDPARASELLAVATELVTEYAPTAPDALHNEAVIRCAGYLNDRPPGARRQRTHIGDYETEVLYEASTSGLRASGAMALLTRYKQRRAGVIR